MRVHKKNYLDRFTSHSRASVLYDKPTNQYRIPTLDEKHLTFQRMATKYQYKPFRGRYYS